MAKTIHYMYRGKAKAIPFTQGNYHSMFEAVAAAEGVDLTRYLQLEQQVEMTSKGSQAVRNFRDQEFARMGFSQIRVVKS